MFAGRRSCTTMTYVKEPRHDSGGQACGVVHDLPILKRPIIPSFSSQRRCMHVSCLRSVIWRHVKMPCLWTTAMAYIGRTWYMT